MVTFYHFSCSVQKHVQGSKIYLNTTSSPGKRAKKDDYAIKRKIKSYVIHPQYIPNADISAVLFIYSLYDTITYEFIKFYSISDGNLFS